MSALSPRRAASLDICGHACRQFQNHESWSLPTCCHQLDITMWQSSQWVIITDTTVPVVSVPGKNKGVKCSGLENSMGHGSGSLSCSDFHIPWFLNIQLCSVTSMWSYFCFCLFTSLSFPFRIQNNQLAILPVTCLFSWHCFLILSFLPLSLSQCGFLLSRTPGHGQVNILGAENVRSGISSTR